MWHTLLMTLLPLTVPIVVGYGWVRAGRPFDTATLGQLASEIGLPCLIFSVLAKAQVSPADFIRTAAAAFACLLLFATIGAVALHLAGLRQRTYLPSIVWGNYGFLGIPLASYAFGDTGLAYAIAFSAVSNAFNPAFSQVIASGATRFRGIAQVVLRTPNLYAAAAGMLALSFHIAVPAFLVRSTSLVGGMTVPLMLLMIGASLARIKAVSLQRATVMATVRVFGCFAVGLLVALVLGLPPLARSILILQCAMPVGVSSYVFAQRWDNEPDEVASLIAVSTWSSAFTIPAALGFLT